MTRNETFYSINKANELLGFDPQHSLARRPRDDSHHQLVEHRASSRAPERTHRR